jgi:hypothetical protein
MGMRLSKQNITDFFRGNSYTVFFATIGLFSQGWWAAKLTLSPLYHGGGALIAVGFIVMLSIISPLFRQYNHRLYNIDERTELPKIIKYCEEREIAVKVCDLQKRSDDSYRKKDVVFVYLEDMLETQLKCCGKKREE